MNVKNYDFYYKLRSLDFIDALLLYGSRARKDNHIFSDIDLAVVCPRATENDWLIIKNIIEEASTLFSIDIIRFDELVDRTTFKENILKNKIILFEKKQTNLNWYNSFFLLGEALNELERVLKHKNDSDILLVQNATIQCFEFSVELFWKTLKKIGISENLNLKSDSTPKEVLQNAFNIGLIQDNFLWTAMIKDRNLSSHLYDRNVMIELYYRIENYYNIMIESYNLIKNKYSL